MDKVLVQEGGMADDRLILGRNGNANKLALINSNCLILETDCALENSAAHRENNIELFAICKSFLRVWYDSSKSILSKSSERISRCPGLATESDC